MNPKRITIGPEGTCQKATGSRRGQAMKTRSTTFVASIAVCLFSVLSATPRK